MNIIKINGTVPGAGKTFTLCKIFLGFKSKNKVILTPSNKAKENAIKILKDFGFEKADQHVKTLRNFKKNYVRSHVEKFWDYEANEWVEKPSEQYITISSSNKESRKPFDLFIDEVSMISKWEMDDLTNHWWIRNIVAAGDVNQFDPIGGWTAVINADREIVVDTKGREIGYSDMGEEWLPECKNLNLTKSMRARDARLTQVLNLIKKGELLEGLYNIMDGKDSKDVVFNDFQDLHIAYTNRKIDNCNKKYENLPKKKYICCLKDDELGIYNAMSISEEKLQDLKNTFIMIHPEDDFNEWQKKHIKLAFGLTCHKLQGSTLEKEKIYIHLDDFLLGRVQEHYSLEDYTKLFQKYLYIAISRACYSSQIQIIGLGKALQEIAGIQDPRTDYEKKVCQLFEDLIKLDDLAKPMQELPPGDFETTADDPKAVEWVLSQMESGPIDCPEWFKKKHKEEMEKRVIDYSARKIDYSNRKPRFTEEMFLEKIKDVPGDQRTQRHVCQELKLMGVNTFRKFKHLLQ